MWYGMPFMSARYVTDALYVHVVAVVYAASCCNHGRDINETARCINMKCSSLTRYPSLFGTSAFRGSSNHHSIMALISTEGRNDHEPLARYARLRVAHAPGMPGTFSPSPQVSDPDMHHGMCVTHVPWCMPGSLTSGFLWNRRRGKTFPAFPAHAHPQFYVSGKRPITNVNFKAFASNFRVKIQKKMETLIRWHTVDSCLTYNGLMRNGVCQFFLKCAYWLTQFFNSMTWHYVNPHNTQSWNWQQCAGRCRAENDSF